MGDHVTFCGVAVAGDRGGPAEACGALLPCAQHPAANRNTVHCRLIKSTVRPDLLSIRLRDEIDPKGAHDLRQALTKTFSAGDLVDITLACERLSTAADRDRQFIAAVRAALKTRREVAPLGPVPIMASIEAVHSIQEAEDQFYGTPCTAVAKEG